MKQGLFPTAWALAFALTFCAAARAQQPSPPKDKEAGKPASAADAWKQALPESEVEATSADAAPAAAGAETFEQIEKRLRALEGRWMEAIKAQDGAALDRILADDFTFVGDQSVAASLDRSAYTASALKDWKLTSYSFDSLTVRVYGDTAVVSGVFKQQAAASGKQWSGDFLVTDVWIKQGRRWRVVTRHLSPAPKVP
ncbi:MAG: nuclear transport factor 2 family protein [Acidobacteria bacterium]|nr:nuclear transport factor 2 family protein [Acidobacteriota bacterium]